MSGRSVSVRVQGEQGVARALQALREVGVPRDHIEVLSDIPLPAALLGGAMKATKLLRFTFTGLVVGLAVGAFFSIGTLFLYPVLVGGQPVYLAPPNIIIVYELTMFGIVVATALGFVLETRRAKSGSRPYWPAVGRGEMYVVVDVPPDFVATRIGAALEARGAELVEPEERLP
jgi:Protein of unknown function (DUF3341).